VRQDLGNELRLLDAGDDLQLATAARAALDLDTEHSPWDAEFMKSTNRPPEFLRAPMPMQPGKSRWNG
jgi:hypothetical protein